MQLLFESFARHRREQHRPGAVHVSIAKQEFRNQIQDSQSQR